MTRFRTVTLASLDVLLALTAFRLSYDAQLTLALASGIHADIAGLYPLVVDAFIIIAMLTGSWVAATASKAARVYPWVADGLFVVVSVGGNVVHLNALPVGALTVPYGIAVAVNAVPAIALFIATHLIFMTVLTRPREVSPTVKTVPVRSTASALPGEKTHHRDIPPVTDAELLALSDSGLSLSKIAAQIGRSKSYVGDRVKAERDRKMKMTA